MRRDDPAPSPVPPIHVVTDDDVLDRDDFLATAEALLATGGPRLALHLRGPAASGGRLECLGAALARARTASGAWLVVHDRVDVAAAVGADGVQLGAGSLSVDAARRVAPGPRVGVSVHHPREAAGAGGADWLTGGTIWSTPSHPGRAGGGPDHLAALVAATAIPVVAIGGVSPARVPLAKAAGAAGVAMIRGVWDARDPLAALDAYLSAWSDA